MSSKRVLQQRIDALHEALDDERHRHATTTRTLASAESAHALARRTAAKLRYERDETQHLLDVTRQELETASSALNSTIAQVGVWVLTGQLKLAQAGPT